MSGTSVEDDDILGLHDMLSCCDLYTNPDLVVGDCQQACLDHSGLHPVIDTYHLDESRMFFFLFFFIVFFPHY
jgi:hypothetical protein